jgi:2-polyprenyl-3-methyl-5-hydroxy-6-metoxy-1,4-benzoquinol methylase
MFQELSRLTRKPQPFEFYTTEILWNDPHISAQMLRYHLDEKVDSASRNRKFIERSTRWMIEHFHIDEQASVCDFGCGPGLYTLGLARTGAQITGIDFSRRSIAYARETVNKENLSIQYINQNYLEFMSNEKFNLILMI